jgi:two-component system chemotaxis response regulator CheY
MMLTQPGWILVVAGDAVRRMALFRLLEQEGLRATVVDDGHAALAMLRTEPFDFVLLDPSSPLLDPAAILTEIRADPLLRRLPVHVLTEPTDHHELARALRKLMNDA